MEQLAAEHRPPTLFAQLIERLSRPGEKTTTLDFENEASYRSVAFDFARRRGIDTIAEYGYAVEAQVERLSNWFTVQSDHVARLWQRANVPFGVAVETSGRNAAIHATRDKDALPAPTADASDLLPAVNSLTQSIAEEARLAQLASPAMLPAVTKFNARLDEEARMRVTETEHYKQVRAALAATGSVIWRDPATAVRMIEDLVIKLLDPERVARAVATEPTAYGPLRGSGRMIDRLLAGGRERRKALQAANAVGADIHSLGRYYLSAFETEKSAVMIERERMAIAIPGLTRIAQNELRHITSETKKNPRELARLVQSLSPDVRQEFSVVSKALDARFGPGAILRNEADVANMVSKSQQTVFKAMLSQLRTVQRAVALDRAEEIIAERQRRTINRARGVDR